jgi:hypothetical protein
MTHGETLDKNPTDAMVPVMPVSIKRVVPRRQQNAERQLAAIIKP